MSKFITFTKFSDNKNTFVNRDKVFSVKKDISGRTCLRSVEGYEVTVAESVDEVLLKLESENINVEQL